MDTKKYILNKSIIKLQYWCSLNFIAFKLTVNKSTFRKKQSWNIAQNYLCSEEKFEFSFNKSIWTKFDSQKMFSDSMTCKNCGSIKRPSSSSISWMGKSEEVEQFGSNLAPKKRKNYGIRSQFLIELAQLKFKTTQI